MSNSFYKIWQHLVFSTIDEKKLIVPAAEQKIHNYMRGQMLELGCPVRELNGTDDHIHLLYIQNPTISVSDTVKQVKGSTSHWINSIGLITDKFAWQKGFDVYSVSESEVENEAAKIVAQKIIHRKITFAEEKEALLRHHKLL